MALHARRDRPGAKSEKADYTACVLGLRDYVDKNRFKGVVLGLSGGIDSALCAAMAADALGAERVRCVMLPYRYTSQELARRCRRDRQDARRALRHRADRKRGEGPRSRACRLFAGAPRDVTEENLQSRARGTILMAMSNKFGPMVVTTGNKSEMSVGYATLYGDMNGGFNPIKDLYKTEVYRLSQLAQSLEAGWARSGRAGEVIPENVITRAPSAELRENQTDQDSLPPYDMLDQILERLVEREEPTATIVAAGFDRDTVIKSSACSISPNTSAARRARRESDIEEFRPRPPLSDRQSASTIPARRCRSPTAPWSKARQWRKREARISEHDPEKWVPVFGKDRVLR